MVIDDQDFPYKATFTRDGYVVEKWNDVRKLNELETGDWDLILLDLQGVGRTQSADEGLGVLQHVRHVAPAQIVIAYSNAENYNLRHEKFFRLADSVLHKSADYLDFKRDVDRLLRQRFSLGFYIERIINEVGEQRSEVPRLERVATRAIVSGSPDRLRKYLERRLGPGIPAIDRAVKIASTGVAIIKLFQTQ